MHRSIRCVLTTVLGVILVFACDPETQVCKDEARAISIDIRDNLYYLLSNTTKIDLLKVSNTTKIDLFKEIKANYTLRANHTIETKSLDCSLIGIIDLVNFSKINDILYIIKSLI